MKISNISISRFRGFSTFKINDMGRITLLVGTNNSGKTTVLEALNILLASGDPSVIWSILTRRGEDIRVERDGAVTGTMRQVDIRRLFRGHEITEGSSFHIESMTDAGERSFVATIEEPPTGQLMLFELEPSASESAEEFYSPSMLLLQWPTNREKRFALPVSSRGGISLDHFRRYSLSPSDDTIRVRYVTASSVSADMVKALFEEIVLTPTEELVTQAIQLIEPSIERIASSGGDVFRPSSRYPSRGGMFVKLRDYKERVPIGSMGDGIWRMLGLALSVVQSSGGMLLVDEIDTGLHHSVMKDLWRFLYRCAKEFDVQIVATTHSRDCFQSLAAICREDVAEGSDVTIHRIEKDQSETVAYTEQEIIAAADLDMEVR